jgi:carboxyl-terminal processing protease
MNSPSTEDKPTAAKNGHKLLGAGMAILLALAAFFSGIEVGALHLDTAPQEAGLFSFLMPATKPSSDANLDEFWRVWNLLDKKFVTSTTTKELTSEEKVWGAIGGLVDSYGDPYTIFLEPEDATQFEDDISGNFGGVGMEVGLQNDLITVIAPLPDSPAIKAGIVAGDIVIKIDGQKTEGMSIDEAVRLIRGEKGTTVKLTIYREGETEFKEIDVVRDNIVVPTIATEVIGDVFVLRLYNFNALSETKVKEAMDQYKKAGHKKLILDLRGNPGGFLQSAVAIASSYLPPGKVIVRENFGGDVEEQIYRSQGGQIGTFTKDNFVVLIDGGSASASEILAGALSEHEVATTLGETTFGKGSVQELVDLPSGASLKVTVARWLTPKGVSFSEGGLEPAVKVSRTPQQVVAGEDTQQAAALKWLSGDKNVGDPDIIAEISTH